jgi:hypothetical protein
MPKENNSSSSVSVTKGSKDRYIVQDMKNFEETQSDIKLMIKPDKQSEESWYSPDFIKIKFKGKK